MRLLIVRLSAIGDVINTLPAFAALRAGLPHAVIGWAVEDRAAGILDGLPGLDRIHRFPRHAWAQGRGLAAMLAHARAIRAERYDTVLDFQGNAKSALHVLLSGARVRWGFAAEHCREGSHVTTNRRVRPASATLNRVEKNLALAAALGVPIPGRLARFEVPAEACEDVDRRLREDGFPSAYTVLHPGTSRFGAFKRWPLQRYAEAGREFHRRTGIPVMVTWGPGERWMARAIVVGIGAGAREAPRLPGLLHLAALLARARVVVGSDSAALHLAARLGVPTVGLYGPKDPRIYAPFGNPGEVLRGEVPCSPCTLRTCGFPECMHRIDASAVVASMERNLAVAGK